ncbi:hypothetical protein, partial [Pseudomonas marginalis]|uniref:hypothetical protein n=1 Tax=Pseudomonas marginalis TaxID=298 RepID=UPI002B1CD086
IRLTMIANSLTQYEMQLYAYMLQTGGLERILLIQTQGLRMMYRRPKRPIQRLHGQNNSYSKLLLHDIQASITTTFSTKAIPQIG